MVFPKYENEILAIGDRRNNAQLMMDCARLGYLDGWVLDVTYGTGRFWRDYQPAILCRFDIDESCGVTVADFTALPLVNGTFDSVVFDPPYKLNGTPTHALDAGYGVGVRATLDERADLITRGLDECLRIARRFVLVKCQDQISSGKYQPQSFMIWEHCTRAGATLIDVLMVRGRRAQPMNTRQLHARRDYSTLLVFKPNRSR